ncbi:ead/Ea22-like family protein [Escherichia coli]|nr:ead/Ea22-like family protein [Escherichia coli]EHL7280925.1 ead/Ea22-like family protein [Escherichia coli]
MNKIDYQALREAAEKAGEDKWQAKKINGDFFVIRHGSYTRQHGYTSYQPIAEIDCKPVRDFVAKANPATVLALLDERERNQQYIKRRDQENKDIALTVGKLRVELEAAKKRIAELEAEPVSQTYKLNELSGNSPVTPDGWVMVPKRLTAENGAKGVLSGEFSETTFISCPECFGDDDCETCDCSGRIEIKVPVSWTTIKTIWAKGCEHFSIVAPQQDG